MIIRAIKLRINTPKGPYGFFFSFSRNLTVIKGNNSSGKSTFFNSLLYSLGMEELVGGKSERIMLLGIIWTTQSRNLAYFPLKYSQKLKTNTGK